MARIRTEHVGQAAAPLAVADVEGQFGHEPDRSPSRATVMRGRLAGPGPVAPA